MRNQIDSDHLLNDVLGESFPADFQAELLDRTLRQVRRRRRVRRCSQSLLALALVVAIPLLLWRKPLPPAQVAQSPPQAFGVVQSQPLAPSMIVESQAASVRIITTSADPVTVVQTRASKDLFREIDDEQLLALAGGRPAGLVRDESGHVEFLLLDPYDRNGFRGP